MLNCPQDKSFETTPGNHTATVIWEDPSVSDNSDRVVNVYCDAEIGSIFPIGQTLVTCEAFDSSGNNETCQFRIDVYGKNDFFRYGYVRRDCCKNNKMYIKYLIMFTQIQKSQYYQWCYRPISEKTNQSQWLYGKTQMLQIILETSLM